MVDDMKRLSELNSKQVVMTVRIQTSTLFSERVKELRSLTQDGLVQLSTQPCM